MAGTGEAIQAISSPLTVFFFFPLVKYHLGEINFADYCVSVEERHPLQMS